MTPRASDALIALRRIQRRTEQASKRLAHMAGMTPSQLVVLQLLDEKGDRTVGDIAKATQLSNATITNLVDKLEAQGLVGRRRDEFDRRRVVLTLLKEGQGRMSAAPDLLQETFIGRFDGLEPWRQAMLISALEQLAELLDAERIDAAPILDVGALDEKPSAL